MQEMGKANLSKVRSGVLEVNGRNRETNAGMSGMRVGGDTGALNCTMQNLKELHKQVAGVIRIISRRRGPSKRLKTA